MRIHTVLTWSKWPCAGYAWVSSATIGGRKVCVARDELVATARQRRLESTMAMRRMNGRRMDAAAHSRRCSLLRPLM